MKPVTSDRPFAKFQCSSVILSDRAIHKSCAKWSWRSHSGRVVTARCVARPSDIEIDIVGSVGERLFSLPVADALALTNSVRRCSYAMATNAFVGSMVATLRIVQTGDWIAASELAGCINVGLIAWLLHKCNSEAGRDWDDWIAANGQASASTSTDTESKAKSYNSDEIADTSTTGRGEVSPIVARSTPFDGRAGPLALLLAYLTSLGLVFREMAVYAMLLSMVNIATSAQQWPGTLPVVTVLAALTSLARLLYNHAPWARDFWEAFVGYTVREPLQEWADNGNGPITVTQSMDGADQTKIVDLLEPDAASHEQATPLAVNSAAPTNQAFGKWSLH